MPADTEANARGRPLPTPRSVERQQDPDHQHDEHGHNVHDDRHDHHDQHPQQHQHQREPVRVLTRIERRIVEANCFISQEPPDRMDFLHSCLCQVGLPRRRVASGVFERRSGLVSVRLEAGTLFNGREFVAQPLPYGVIPRLVMVHVSSEAVRTRSRSVEVGDSMRQFLRVLGIPASGGQRGGYTAFKRQMEALAACRLTLGMHAAGRAVTVDAKPIDRFDAWLHTDGSQRSLWPGAIELSERFFSTLVDHAVPLDYRALAALRHSALALDVYSWLAHRLRRVARPQGVKVSWHNLREQFGQEYACSKNFKRELRGVLGPVRRVYPDAKLQEVPGGLILYPSRPPLAPARVALGPAANRIASPAVDGSVDRAGDR